METNQERIKLTCHCCEKTYEHSPDTNTTISHDGYVGDIGKNCECGCGNWCCWECLVYVAEFDGKDYSCVNCMEVCSEGKTVSYLTYRKETDELKERIRKLEKIEALYDQLVEETSHPESPYVKWLMEQSYGELQKA